MVDEQAGRGSASRTISTPSTARRLAERNRALELWTKRDRRVADATAGLFRRHAGSGLLDLPRLRGQPVVAGRAGWRIRRIGALARADSPGRRSGPPGRRFLFQGAGAAGRPMGRPGGAKGSNTSTSSTLTPPISTSSARARSSSVCARPERGPARRRSPRGCSTPATPATIRQRHEAVAELRPRLDLREDLELLGVEVRGGIDPAALAGWSNRRARVSRQDGLRRRDDPGNTRHRRTRRLDRLEYADVPARDDRG